MFNIAIVKAAGKLAKRKTFAFVKSVRDSRSNAFAKG